MATDPHYSSTSLLLLCDGASGSTAFVDSSARPKTVTATGSVSITTAQSKFGGACLTSVGGYLTVPAHADLVFGTGDFTVEMWVRTTKSNTRYLLSIGAAWSLRIGGGTLLWDGAGGLVETPRIYHDGRWQHIAISRESGVLRFFVDGWMGDTPSDPANYSSAASLFIGSPNADEWTGDNFRGEIDELRITKGVARYTSAFSVPTESFSGSSEPEVTLFTASVMAPSLLGSPQAAAFFIDSVAALAAAASPLGAPRALSTVFVPTTALATAPSPFGRFTAKGLHDFTGLLGDASTRYVMDLITPGGAVRVPISSWQATLQTGSSNYVQCVVPACAPYVAQLNAASEFVIYRRAELPDGSALEYEMARAPTGQTRFDRGPQRHTCTLAGYSTAFVVDEDPPAAYNRPLVAVRSISSGQGGMRVRCAVDWLLRPGHRAFADGVPFVASYINYYSPSGGDGYMDVGERT